MNNLKLMGLFVCLIPVMGNSKTTGTTTTNPFVAATNNVVLEILKPTEKQAVTLTVEKKTHEFTQISSTNYPLSDKRTPEDCELNIGCLPEVVVPFESDYSPAITGLPQIISSCGTVTITYIDEELIGGCSTLKREFIIEDSSGNTMICSQQITIENPTALSSEEELSIK